MFVVRGTAAIDHIPSSGLRLVMQAGPGLEGAVRRETCRFRPWVESAFTFPSDGRKGSPPRVSVQRDPVRWLFFASGPPRRRWIYLVRRAGRGVMTTGGGEGREESSSYRPGVRGKAPTRAPQAVTSLSKVTSH